MHPGFMTDWQQPLVVALTQADGISILHETVYENRLGFTGALNDMGARIQVYRVPRRLLLPLRLLNYNHLRSSRARWPCTPRTSPSRTCAAASPTSHRGVLGAEGVSTIRRIGLIDRGYESFRDKLTALGAEYRERRGVSEEHAVRPSTLTAGAAGSLALVDIPIPTTATSGSSRTGGRGARSAGVLKASFAHENGSAGSAACAPCATRRCGCSTWSRRLVPSSWPTGVGLGGPHRGRRRQAAVRIGVALLPGGELPQVITAKYKTVRGPARLAPRRLMHAAAVNTLALRRRRRRPPPA